MLSDDLREYEELCKYEDENIWYDTSWAIESRYRLPDLDIDDDRSPAFSQGMATDKEIRDLMERLHFSDRNALFLFLDREFLNEYARRARYFQRYAMVAEQSWLGEEMKS